ncbi:MAG: peptidyl-prolyl cis-trans isomerase B (cyclophilin B) [Gammaproteobacteria bacterium]|jgi:peptidyl-prolyl cis-trans isomerase B (cyclophilin B)
MLKRIINGSAVIKATIILFSCLYFQSYAFAEEQLADAVIETKFGNIELKLFPDVAPGHVENFLKLAKSGFYDGTVFHRVIPGFMIQGGDPNSKGSDRSIHGTGGPGYSIKAEFSDKPHVRGVLSMARSSAPDSAGSQFFIVIKESSFLNNQYTVFGEVISGLDVADKIVSQERDARDNPLERIEMKIRVVEAEKISADEMSESEEK